MTMTKQPEHTPLPFVWETDNSSVVIGAHHNEVDCAIAHMSVEEIDGISLQMAIANAQFIVKACNMHDELVEALEWFCDRVDRGEVRSKKTYARYKEIIAKAKGDT